MEQKKILFLGLSNSTVNKIRNLFDSERYIPLFASFDEADEYIKKETPSIIAAGDSSIHDNTEYMRAIKKLASDKGIPFIAIISGSSIKPYVAAQREDFSAVITTPIMKGDFFNLIDSCIEEKGFDKTRSCHETDESAEAAEGVPGFTGSLIHNIVAQNRIVKKLLRRKKLSSELPHSIEKGIEKFRETEAELWYALDNNWFRLHYQPVISLDTGRLAGFEALIRIQHPEKGVIMPGDFISVAESSAIIFPLGLWIIEEACRQIEYWKGKYSFDIPVRININLSAKQFIHPQLTSHIFEIVDRYGVDHNDIGFELTESAFMDDMESANISLLELRSRKFQLYMDDFGTGYSSLSYLMHFPMDIIKIDQSFVKWMHIDEQSETLVKSIVNLAHNLSLKVVAEGVDDESHIDILKSCGCDYVQGYYLSKPLPADKADEFVSRHFECREMA